MRCGGPRPARSSRHELLERVELLDLRRRGHLRPGVRRQPEACEPTAGRRRGADLLVRSRLRVRGRPPRQRRRCAAGSAPRPWPSRPRPRRAPARPAGRRSPRSAGGRVLSQPESQADDSPLTVQTTRPTLAAPSTPTGAPQRAHPARPSRDHGSDHPALPRPAASPGRTRPRPRRRPGGDRPGGVSQRKKRAVGTRGGWHARVK